MKIKEVRYEFYGKVRTITRPGTLMKVIFLKAVYL